MKCWVIWHNVTLDVHTELLEILMVMNSQLHI